MSKPFYDDLYYFCQVSQAGSFLLASERLGVASSTIARIITNLEKQLGKKCFNRNRTGLTLTEYGKNLYNEISPLLEKVDFHFKKDEAEKNNRKVIKVFMAVGIAEWTTSEGISVIQDIPENVELRINTYKYRDFIDEVSHIRNTIEQYDIIYLHENYLNLTSPNNWKLVYRAKDKFKLFASEQYLEKNGIPNTLEELSDHNCILSSWRNNNYWQLSDGVKDQNIYVHSTTSVDILSACFNLVKNNIGISILPELLVERYNQGLSCNNKLINILPQYFVKEPPLCILKNIHSAYQAELNIIAEKIKGYTHSLYK